MPGVERLQRLGGRAAERPDERAVVDVVDLAGAVVELELLERRERAVARLHQRQPTLARARGADVDRSGCDRLAQERQRDDHRPRPPR